MPHERIGKRHDISYPILHIARVVVIELLEQLENKKKDKVTCILNTLQPSKQGSVHTCHDPIVRQSQAPILSHTTACTCIYRTAQAERILR